MTRRERRVLAIGGAAVVTILLCGRLVPAILQWTRVLDLHARLLQEEVTRANADVLSLRAVKDSADARGRLLRAASSWLITGKGAPSAAAALAGAIRDVADSVGIRVGNMDLAPDSSRTGVFDHPRATISVSGDERTLVSFLADVEGSVPRLAVLSLTITQDDPFAPSNQREALQATVTIEGVAARAPLLGRSADGVGIP